MKNSSDSESHSLSGILIVLLIIMSAGWYCAEQDNEILLQELEAQSYTKPVHYHHEDKKYDR